MMITVDPTELSAASETLRSCAVEAADIGSQLWSCAQCPMPADIQPLVDGLVGATDRALDSVAARLGTFSVDLANRAQIATTDSLAAASVAVDPNSQLAATLTGGTLLGTSVIGGANDSLFGGFTVVQPDGTVIDPTWMAGMTTVSTVGGPNDSLFGGFTVVQPDGTVIDPTWMTGMTTTTTIGGNNDSLFGGFTITNPDGSVVDPTWMAGMTKMSVIGAPDYTGTPMSGILALAQASDNLQQDSRNRINAIVNNPLASAEAVRVALNANSHLGDGTAHLLAPSRSELEASVGHALTDSEIKMMSPNTIMEPVNIFARN